MKLLSISRQVARGESAGLAWVVAATFAGAYGWCFFFHLPLFQLAEKYVPEWGSMRFGWWVPVLGVRADASDWWLFKVFVGWQFHSDFMDERVERYV